MRTLRFQRDCLITLCGPAGSGKSYFARAHFARDQIIGSDMCRQLIYDDSAEQMVSADAFDLFYMIIAYRLKYGRLTVADATNLSGQYRRRLVEIAGTYGRAPYLVLLDTRVEQCLKHNAMRERRVEDQVIRAQTDRFDQVKEFIEHERSNYADVYTVYPHEVEHVEITLV